MKKYNEALIDINRAILLNPDNADAYLLSADVNYNLGNYNQALEAATRAQSLGKPVSDAFIQQLKARISQVSSPD
jgi:tetratricopeptide (TPR) repeat protein